ncbi:Cysteine desulfurase [Stieleria varia]|uniref:Cysteine desulfurase n=2 Tax=Stieleria varia TaxID=2528005 RepID=A0A5C6BB01_9BACT|nr:Cysteine desulfurase [Stieleria varia]
MQPYWSTHFMLPGQQHAQAQAVSEALEHAREGIAELAGCESFEVVFTGGGTEANNLAILGVLSDQPVGHVLYSCLEHESVLGPLERLTRLGWEIEPVPCGANGIIDTVKVDQMIRPDTRLMCLQAANAVVGTIQPVRQVADICHSRGVVLHSDATQVFGKMPIDVTQLRADTVSISGHKFYGPKGSGALYVRRGLKLAAITYGEPREMGLRPGAENIPGCVGLGAAAMLAQRCCVDAADKLAEMRDKMIEDLRQQVPGGITVLCEAAERLPNTLAIELPADTSRLQESARQLAISTPQSSSPPDEMTRVLRSIGRSEQQACRTMRISLGWTTSSEQLSRAVKLIAAAYDGR